jgi:hypothetical protein
LNTRSAWIVFVLGCTPTTHPPPHDPAPIRTAIDAGEPMDSGRDGRDASLSSSLPPPRPPAIDPDAWMRARGVPGTDALLERLGACREVHVGAPAREALLCVGGPPMAASFASGESVFPLIIAIAEKGKARAVLQIPIAAGALDRLGPNDSNYLDLTADLDQAGTVLTVSEQPKAGCAERVAAHRAIGGLERHIRMIELACRSRGRWVWHDASFVHE